MSENADAAAPQLPSTQDARQPLGSITNLASTAPQAVPATQKNKRAAQAAQKERYAKLARTGKEARERQRQERAQGTHDPDAEEEAVPEATPGPKPTPARPTPQTHIAGGHGLRLRPRHVPPMPMAGLADAPAGEPDPEPARGPAMDPDPDGQLAPAPVGQQEQQDLQPGFRSAAEAHAAWVQLASADPVLSECFAASVNRSGQLIFIHCDHAVPFKLECSPRPGLPGLAIQVVVNHRPGVWVPVPMPAGFDGTKTHVATATQLEAALYYFQACRVCPGDPDPDHWHYSAEFRDHRWPFAADGVTPRVIADTSSFKTSIALLDCTLRSGSCAFLMPPGAKGPCTACRTATDCIRHRYSEHLQTNPADPSSKHHSCYLSRGVLLARNEALKRLAKAAGRTAARRAAAVAAWKQRARQLSAADHEDLSKVMRALVSGQATPRDVFARQQGAQQAAGGEAPVALTDSQELMCALWEQQWHALKNGRQLPAGVAALRLSRCSLCTVLGIVRTGFNAGCNSGYAGRTAGMRATP